jgi:hypothetical protein
LSFIFHSPLEWERVRVKGVQVKMFGNDHSQKGKLFSADYLPVQGWEPIGIEAGCKRDGSGTKVGRKRNAARWKRDKSKWDASGKQAKRKWDGSGTEVGYKRDKPKNVRQIKPAALRLKQGGIFQAGNARIILRINRN